MSPLKLSNLTKAGPEKREIAEVQDKDFKIAFMNMPEGQRKWINPLNPWKHKQTVE